MRDTALILIADDNAANLDILEMRLSVHGYDIRTATDGAAALAAIKHHKPDLVLLDVMMPKMDGLEVLAAMKELRSEGELPFTPVILVTAKADPDDVVAGLDAGAEEYLTKPVDQTALVARVRSMLRVKALQDKTEAQAESLSNQAQELQRWNLRLADRVAEKVEELRRANQLLQFFPPQIAELIVSSGEEDLMKTHRREIAAVFCDLRGFTAFSEQVEPESVMNVLSDFHGAVGPVIDAYGATLEYFAGDGLMAFLGAPIACPDAERQAVLMSLDMAAAVAALVPSWQQAGYNLGLGIGVDHGPATLGKLGYAGRFHYGAIGQVINIAQRLSDAAPMGQVYISAAVSDAVGDTVELEALGGLSLKGLSSPIEAYRVTAA